MKGFNNKKYVEGNNVHYKREYRNNQTGIIIAT